MKKEDPAEYTNLTNTLLSKGSDDNFLSYINKEKMDETPEQLKEKKQKLKKVTSNLNLKGINLQNYQSAEDNGDVSPTQTQVV